MVEALGETAAGTGVSADGEAVTAGGGAFGAGASPPIIVALSEMRSCGTTGRSSGLSPPGLSPNRRAIFSSRSASFETVGRAGASSSAGGFTDKRPGGGGSGGRDVGEGAGGGGAAAGSAFSPSPIASPLGMSMLVGSAFSGIGGSGRPPRGGGGGGAGRAPPSPPPPLSRSAVELLEAPVPSSIVTMKSPT